MSTEELWEQIHELQDEVSRLEVKAYNAEYDLRASQDECEELENENRILNQKVTELNSLVRHLEMQLTTGKNY
jgi:hypothetical protein